MRGREKIRYTKLMSVCSFLSRLPVRESLHNNVLRFNNVNVKTSHMPQCQTQWPVLRYCSSISMKVQKDTKNFTLHNWPNGFDLNRVY